MKTLSPLGFLYEKAAGLKNFLYDKDLLTSLKLPVPVISLGNLTVGGTGKTPLTHFCLQYLKTQNKKTAVISRNYRAEVKSAAKVDLVREGAARYFGDEPVLLAMKNQQASFFVGPEKFKTAQYAYDLEKPEVLIVDDGFQHRQLSRDLDLVILDATETWTTYQCLPVGRAREPWSALERASAFLITKVNLASEQSVTKLIENLKPFNKPTFTFNFEIENWYELNSGLSLNEKMQGQKVMLVSGIGRPQAFEKSLQSFAVNIVKHIRFKDHYVYERPDLQEILDVWERCGRPILLTTEKDAVKLKDLWPRETPLWVAPLEVKINSREEKFYEILAQALR